MQRTGIAPVVKGVTDYGNEEIPIYRDSQPVTSENLDGNAINFFPRNPEGGAADSNYTQKPFSGDYPYDVVALGFTLSHFAMVDDPTIGAYPESLIELVNAMAHGRAVMRSDNRREEFLDEHAQQVLTFDSLGYSLAGDAANDGFVERVEFKAVGALRLPEPLRIEVNEVFELEFEFDDTSPIPSEANYGTLAQGGQLHMIAEMQVIYDDSEQGPKGLPAQAQAQLPAQARA